ncbi:hypothetical protein [Pseudomonas sp. GM17]|uniref:hypothetical protein n=1 Tax=Pseudomonas sp. GM17 TaxID=1144323 RepID=UPI00138B19CB|nr:hypothetical protein [Pseudomonas sp. GM17]WIE50226.1 hypothetical protein PMI20_001030 [Pseudomonas sp. GM17]
MKPLEDLRSYRSLRQRLQVWGGIRGEWGRSGFAEGNGNTLRVCHRRIGGRSWSVETVHGQPQLPELQGVHDQDLHHIVNAAHLLLQDGCDALDALQWRIEA